MEADLKYKIIYLGILAFSIIILSCENDNTIIAPTYGSFQGNWHYTFRYSNGSIDTGTYHLLSDGNVMCSGENCTEIDPESHFISRTWKQSVNDLEITLKYVEISSNIQITGNFNAIYENVNKFNGTLTWSNGNQGTWSAVRY